MRKRVWLWMTTLLLLLVLVPSTHVYAANVYQSLTYVNVGGEIYITGCDVDAEGEIVRC